MAVGAVVIAVLLAILIPNGWFTVETFISLVGILGIIIPIIYFVVMYRSPKTTAEERSRVIAYIPLFVASAMFWAIQEQGSTILANYADKRTQLDVAGIHLSPAWFQSLNPLFIIILAPVFAWMWVKLGKRQPTIPQKIRARLVVRRPVVHRHSRAGPFKRRGARPSDLACVKLFHRRAW